MGFVQLANNLTGNVGVVASLDSDREEGCLPEGSGKLKDWGEGLMGEGLSGIHEMLGGIVVVMMIVVAILAAISAGGGSSNLLRPASMLAAGLYLLQILLGIVLIGGGARNATGHYLVGLLILVPVALQHSSAKRMQARTRDYTIMICALAAAFLSVLAYASGSFGIFGPA